MARKLTIITRTCGRVFAIHGSRYIDKSKPEIINVCLSSLIHSINQVKDHDIELFVLDDNSNPECLADIKQIVDQCKFPSHVVSCEGTGITGASQTCSVVYKWVEEYCTDLWLHIEDDYLCFPELINDMIESVDQFEANTGCMIAINPHDDPHRYTRQIYDSILLFGPHRHYRTVRHSTYTCLASRAIYDKYRNYFQDSAEWILRKTEDETINQVWNQADVMMFSPIPSLALHLGDETVRDPYIDVDRLWFNVPQLWKNNTL